MVDGGFGGRGVGGRKDTDRGDQAGGGLVGPDGSRKDTFAANEAISAQQASDVLGVAVKTLANWRAAALGPPYRKYGSRNGPVRYVLSELIAWRDTHRRGEG